MNTATRFCWTRYGTESGELIEDILRRKETQRRTHGGMFLWGVGNSVGPAIRELVRLESNPKVLFSPMRSRPKVVDTAPSRVITWMQASTLDGDDWEVPEGLRVISRGATEGGAMKRTHYALVCHSSTPLEISADNAQILPYDRLVNLLSQNKLGHSQVTAVVEQLHPAAQGSAASNASYPVGFEAELVYPYFVRLSSPVGEGDAGPRRRSEQTGLALFS